MQSSQLTTESSTEVPDIQRAVNAVLTFGVLSVFTKAENLLSKSKYCAKSESQTAS